MNIIQFENVSKHFEDGIIPKKIQVLQNVNFTVESGNTYAFLGPNGAGKTTTINLMLNFLKPSSGKITIFDSTPQNSKIREKIGYVSDHPYFYEYLSAREYLKFCADLYNLPKEKITTKIDSMLEVVGLSDSSEIKLRKFSRGMGQRLSFAQALLHNPELIILDEPLNGLDPFGRKDLKNLILDLKSQGKTLFFSSHILEDSEMLADYVIFIDKGNIVHQDKLANINIEKPESKLEDIFVSLIAKDKNEEH